MAGICFLQFVSSSTVDIFSLYNLSEPIYSTAKHSDWAKCILCLDKNVRKGGGLNFKSNVSTQVYSSIQLALSIISCFCKQTDWLYLKLKQNWRKNKIFLFSASKHLYEQNGLTSSVQWLTVGNKHHQLFLETNKPTLPKVEAKSKKKFLKTFFLLLKTLFTTFSSKQIQNFA